MQATPLSSKRPWGEQGNEPTPVTADEPAGPSHYQMRPKLKILLVQPNYQNPSVSKGKIDNITGVHPPIGLMYLAAVLKRHGFSPEILDANLHRARVEAIIEKANRFDIVGVSVLNQGHDFAVKLVQHLKPQILKVCGGPHATGYYESLLNDGFDVVVLGEGETSFLAICQGTPLEQISGIAFKGENGLMVQPSNAFLDVNILPPPARELLPNGGTIWPYASAGTTRFPWAPIVTSRGCPFHCYYCNKTIHGHRFRARRPEDVVDEMAHLVRSFGVREFDIVDDVFNLDMARAIRICDLIIARDLNITMRFGNGIRADRISAELAKKLKRAGTSYVAFGLESGNQQVLNSIPKKITLDQIRCGVARIQAQGMHTTGLFMLGLLEDTEESMHQTIDFAKALNLDIAYFSIATPYPGTRFYDLVKERGKLLVSDWKDFNHSYGQVFYEYPGAPSKELVLKMFRKAYRSFYFRPGYMLTQISKSRSINDWRVVTRGAKDLCRNQIGRAHV